MDWNPIQVYDHMAADSDAVYCPYGFGYTNYSRSGTAVPLKFADAPAATRDSPAVQAERLFHGHQAAASCCSG